MELDKIKTGAERAKYTRKNLYSTKKQDQVALKVRMSEIISTYQSIMEESALEKRFIDYFIQGHCKQTEWTSGHTRALLQGMKVNVVRMTKMMSRLEFFQSICTEDQNLLFQLNQALFYQYLLSRYIKSGSTQICWLLAKDPVEVFGKS